MRVSSDYGDLVEIDIGEKAGVGDVLLVVRVRRGQFSAEIDTWVQQRSWFSFAQDLSILEEKRRGEARIESISPGELCLVFRSLDNAGHVGVEGFVGVRTFDTEVSLRFSVFSFDPSQLVILARSARTLSEQIG